MNEDFTYDEWFDIFLGVTKKLNYHGPVDKDTFREDYDDGKTPEESAEAFVKEMNS